MIKLEKKEIDLHIEIGVRDEPEINVQKSVN